MAKTRIVVGDTETDGLNPTVVHCCVFKDINTGEVFKFVQGECLTVGKRFIEEEVAHIIGHNWLDYDAPKVLKKLMGVDWKTEDTTDTYVMSRVGFSDRWLKDLEKVGNDENRYPPEQRMLLKHKSHGLAAWGCRVGRFKPDIENWDFYTPEILHRCAEDVEINHLVYKMLVEELKDFSNYSVRLEHQAAAIISEMCRNGVPLDLRATQELQQECDDKAQVLRVEIVKAIPPRVTPLELAPHYIEPTVKEVKVWNGGFEDRPDGRGRIRSYRTYDVIRSISPKTRYYKALTEAGFSIRGPFSPISIEEFNPDSPDQRLEVLDAAGWKPVNFNKPSPKMLKEGRKVGNPKTTDEENLATLPDTAPEAVKTLGRYIMLTNRSTIAKGWLEAVQPDGRIHGHVNSCGTPTARCTHTAPQLANIVSVEDIDKFTPDEALQLGNFIGGLSKVLPFQPIPEGHPYAGNLLVVGNDNLPKKVVLVGEAGGYGWECRKCFTVKDLANYCMVGFDAASLEIRMLAHYMNDPAFTWEVLNGDIYIKIQQALGLKSRKIAKAILLALIYGAGDAKLGLLVGGSVEAGALIRAGVMNFLPALKKLVDKVQADFKKNKGWLRGLDGRRLNVRKRHSALNTLLQSAGAIVMKQCMVTAYRRIKELGLDAGYMLYVHDEFQFYSARTTCQKLGEILHEAIRQTGVFFKMKIQLDGEFKIGNHWGECH